MGHIKELFTPKPSVEPTVISLRVLPGQVANAIVKLDQIPSDANVTASIDNDNSLIRLKLVIAHELIHRPLTPEEIEELPSSPPSIRKNAAKIRITELVEIGRSDGSTPLAVTTGSSVEVQVECLPPALGSPELTAATLVIQGSSWERVEVPVFLFVGQATIQPTIDPASIQLGIAPGEVRTADLSVIGSKVTGSTVVGYVLHGASLIKVKQFIVFRPIKKDYTAEEIADMPQELRENATRRGYIAYQESSRSDGSTPLNVPPNVKLRVTLEFTAPIEQAPDSVSATFVLEGTAWQRMEVPLFMGIREIITTLTPRVLTIRQGENAQLQLQVTSLAGPPTDLTFALAERPGTEGWKFLPSVVHVGRRSAVSQAAQIIVDPRAPVGTISVALTVTAFDGIVIDNRPVVLTIAPGVITVNLVQNALTGMQGDHVASDVLISTKGGTTSVELLPGPLPPGVVMDPSGTFTTPGGTATTQVGFHIDPLTKPVAGFTVTIFWAAEDGVNKGTLTLSLTVLLRPESKSFSQPILTPAGTALGGTVALVLHNDGNFNIQGHLHDSGFPSYKFRIRAAASSANGKVVVVAQKSGDVEGTEVELLPFNTARRDFDWNETGFSQKIIDHWPAFRSGTMRLSKSYEIAGVLGGIADIVADVLGFVIADVLLGPQLALVVAIGAELSSLTNASFVGPGGLVGVSVAGGIVWLFGTGMVGAAVVFGVVAGAVTDAMIKHRTLADVLHSASTAAEKQFVADLGEIFGDTLPPAERIILTNLSNDNRAFTWPNVDGSILVNLSEAFDDPMGHTQPNYPKPGQVLVHELTHAWQIANSSFLPGFICEGAVTGGKNYNYGPPFLEPGTLTAPPWSSYSIEQQAAIVDQWFGGTRVGSKGPKDQDDPYFGYILNNIQLGQP